MFAKPCRVPTMLAEWQEWRNGFLLSVGLLQEASAKARGAPRTRWRIDPHDFC
jgi:hypothetical protein